MALGQTAYTTPVGYVSLGNTNAAPAWPTDTDIYVSVPLEREAEWQGVVVSVDVVNSIITLNTTPDFVVDKWLPSVTANPATLDPYILKIEGTAPTTPSAGLVAQITDNDANTVTVVVPPGDSLAGVAVGNSVSIRRAFTPQSFFAGNTLPANVQILLWDGALGIEQSFTGSYTYKIATNTWEDDTFGGDVTHAILFPSELLVLRNQSGADVSSLVVSGTVPTSSQRTILSVPDAAAGQDIPLSYFSPVGQLVADSGLPVVTGDQILAYDNVTPGIDKSYAASYTYKAATNEWEDDTFGGDASSFLKFEGGVSYYLRKPATTAVTGDAVWSNLPSYIP